MPTLMDQHPRKLAGFGDNQSTFVKMHLMQHGIYLEYFSFGPKWHRKKNVFRIWWWLNQANDHWFNSQLGIKQKTKQTCTRLLRLLQFEFRIRTAAANTVGTATTPEKTTAYFSIGIRCTQPHVCNYVTEPENDSNGHAWRQRVGELHHFTIKAAEEKTWLLHEKVKVYFSSRPAQHIRFFSNWMPQINQTLHNLCQNNCPYLSKGRLGVQQTRCLVMSANCLPAWESQHWRPSSHADPLTEAASPELTTCAVLNGCFLQ